MSIGDKGNFVTSGVQFQQGYSGPGWFRYIQYTAANDGTLTLYVDAEDAFKPFIIDTVGEGNDATANTVVATSNENAITVEMKAGDSYYIKSQNTNNNRKYWYALKAEFTEASAGAAYTYDTPQVIDGKGDEAKDTAYWNEVTGVAGQAFGFSVTGTYEGQQSSGSILWNTDGTTLNGDAKFGVIIEDAKTVDDLSVTNYTE